MFHDIIFNLSDESLCNDFSYLILNLKWVWNNFISQEKYTKELVKKFKINDLDFKNDSYGNKCQTW